MTAIYRHFRDKDALIQELCMAAFTALGQAMYKIGRIEDPEERMRRMGLAYADFALDNPSQHRFILMTQQGHRHPDNADHSLPDQDAYRFLLQTVREGIEARRYRPELADPEELAQIFWSGVHGIVALHYTHRDDPYINWRPPREMVRSMVDIMLRGAVRAD